MSGRILATVSRIHLAWKRRVARDLAPYGITPKQIHLLRRLDESGGLAPSAIADLFYADRPSVTSMLGTLERAGWVRRRPDPADGRRSVVELTAQGRTQLASVPEALWRSGRTRLDPEGRLAPEERVQLQALLDKLAAAVEEAP